MTKLATEPFWSANQPGFRFTDYEPGTAEFYAEVEKHRYELEPHIAEIVQFERWRERDVLEVGCGIATDGVNFARAGGHYVGVDQSPRALELARRRFELENLPGQFISAAATRLPFDDESFDLVFSHGVLHHIEHPESVIAEIHRVLRPSGTALVMVYHRRSLNYAFTIMTLRRLFASLLLIPGAPRVVARITGEQSEVLNGQRRLLQVDGFRYIRDRSLFLSNNTDGPGNPLSRAYSPRELVRLFSRFSSVATEVRFLNLRLYPGGDGLARTKIAHILERWIGWHLYLRATK